MSPTRNLISGILNFSGCGILIPGNIFLLNPTTTKLGITLYIIGYSQCLACALIDLFPHALNRPVDDRQEDNESLISDSQGKYSNWLIKLWVFIFCVSGASFLLAGSILDLPSIEEIVWVTWTFRTGSSSYLIASVLSLYSLWSPFLRKERIKGVEADCTVFLLTLMNFSFILGSISFLSGGVLAQLGLGYSVILWIVGAFCITFGALFCLMEAIRGLST